MTCQLYLPIQYFSKPLLQSKVQVSNVYRIHAGVMGRHLPTSTITIPSPRHSPPTCHAARLPPLMPLPSHLSCHSPSTCHDTPLPPVTPLLSHLSRHSPPTCHATSLPPVMPLPSHLLFLQDSILHQLHALLYMQDGFILTLFQRRPDQKGRVGGEEWEGRRNESEEEEEEGRRRRGEGRRSRRGGG